jgi:hypothetical protein
MLLPSADHNGDEYDVPLGGMTNSGWKGRGTPPLRIGHFVGGQDLQCDETVQALVARLIDRAHPSFAQLLDDRVLCDATTDHEFEASSR